MEKDFVPYLESLELIELGFNEPCFGYYIIDSQELVNDKWTKHPNKSNWTINAPTFSQSFRWFREKHNLHSHISLGISDEQDRSEFEYDEYTFVIEGVKELDFNNYGEESFYKTPEEAELACLKKLIEIVKEK